MVNFRNLLLNNLFLKLISLFFAIILWFYITPVVSRDTLEMNYALPLQLKNIPDDMIVTGKVEDHINVRLKGRQSIIRDLDPDELNVSLNLSGAREGARYYTLDHDNLNVPGKVDVVSMNPRKIKIDIVRLMRKEVDVKANISGKPASGYRIKSVSVSPAKIILEGPESEIIKAPLMEDININVSGRRSSFSKEVKVKIPLRNLRILGNDIVIIDVEVERI
ncbi:MAG: hypothetical protein A2Y48_08700 [Nitrospirae bacterium RIFCSPLOW2_12_42_9]|nr:MAG: hypothetical protein A2Y48_08700 [Nitrospirae bacterium RIFCSPLOW2_12_42_9]HBI22855.1 hypothetical protein [Nitrospiraceae bacterium]